MIERIIIERRSVQINWISRVRDRRHFNYNQHTGFSHYGRYAIATLHLCSATVYHV